MGFWYVCWWNSSMRGGNFDSTRSLLKIMNSYFEVLFEKKSRFNFQCLEFNLIPFYVRTALNYKFIMHMCERWQLYEVSLPINFACEVTFRDNPCIKVLHRDNINFVTKWHKCKLRFLGTWLKSPFHDWGKGGENLGPFLPLFAICCTF